MRKNVTSYLRIALSGLFLMISGLYLQAAEPTAEEIAQEKKRLLEKLRQQRGFKPYKEPVKMPERRPGVGYEKRNRQLEEAKSFRESDYKGTFQEMREDGPGMRPLPGAERRDKPEDEEDADRKKNWIVPAAWEGRVEEEKQRLRGVWEEENGPLDDERAPTHAGQREVEEKKDSLFERGRKQGEDWKDELKEDDFTSEEQMLDIMSIFGDGKEDAESMIGGTKRNGNERDERGTERMRDGALEIGQARDRFEPAIRDDRRERTDDLRRDPVQPIDPEELRGLTDRRDPRDDPRDPGASLDASAPQGLSRTQELLSRITQPLEQKRAASREDLPRLNRLLPSSGDQGSRLSRETDRILGRLGGKPAPRTEPATPAAGIAADPRFHMRFVPASGIPGGSLTGSNSNLQPSLSIHSAPPSPSLRMAPPTATGLGAASPAPSASGRLAPSPQRGILGGGTEAKTPTKARSYPGLNDKPYRMRSRLNNKSSVF